MTLELMVRRTHLAAKLFQALTGRTGSILGTWAAWLIGEIDHVCDCFSR